MSSPVVRAAMSAEIARLAGPLLVVDVEADPRIGDIPPTDVPWLAVAYAGAEEVVESIGTQGSDCWLETTTVQLHYFAPAGTPSAPAIAALDTIRRGLRAARLGAVTVMGATPPQLVGTHGRWIEHVSFLDVEHRNFG